MYLREVALLKTVGIPMSHPVIILQFLRSFLVELDATFGRYLPSAKVIAKRRLGIRGCVARTIKNMWRHLKEIDLEGASK